jgi:hypothetical protein
VISPFDGVPALMLRIANQRHIMMAEAEFRLMLFIKMDYGRIHDTEEAGSKPRA